MENATPICAKSYENHILDIGFDIWCICNYQFFFFFFWFCMNEKCHANLRQVLWKSDPWYWLWYLMLVQLSIFLFLLFDSAWIKMPRQFTPGLMKIRSLILALITDAYAIINFSYSFLVSPSAQWAFCGSQTSHWSCLMAKLSTKSVHPSVGLTGRVSTIRRVWLFSLFFLLFYIFSIFYWKYPHDPPLFFFKFNYKIFSSFF